MDSLIDLGRRIESMTAGQIFELIYQTVDGDPTLAEPFVWQVAYATFERDILPARLARLLRSIRWGARRPVNPIRAPGNYFCVCASRLLDPAGASRRRKKA